MNSKTSEEPASLMNVVLPGGVRLGDATRQQVMEAVEHYRKQQEKYTAKARQYSLLPWQPPLALSRACQSK